MQLFKSRVPCRPSTIYQISIRVFTLDKKKRNKFIVPKKLQRFQFVNTPSVLDPDYPKLCLGPQNVLMKEIQNILNFFYKNYYLRSQQGHPLFEPILLKPIQFKTYQVVECRILQQAMPSGRLAVRNWHCRYWSEREGGTETLK